MLYRPKLLHFEVVGLESLAFLGKLDNLLALREVARNLVEVFGNVGHLEVGSLALVREDTLHVGLGEALAVLVVCNFVFNGGEGLRDERSGHGTSIHVEHVELAVHDERCGKRNHLGSRSSGRSSSLLGLLTLLALGLLVGLGCRRKLGGFGSGRHLEAVAGDGFGALRGEQHPFVVDLGRGLLALLVQARVHLVAVDVELDLEVRFGLGGLDGVTALHVLGAAGEDAVAANGNLIELEFALLEFFLVGVLFLGRGVDSGVHPHGRHRDRLFSERIEHDTFNGTSLVASGHAHGDESGGTSSHKLFLHRFFLVL